MGNDPLLGTTNNFFQIEFQAPRHFRYEYFHTMITDKKQNILHLSASQLLLFTEYFKDK